jgi:hypothetical protein
MTVQEGALLCGRYRLQQSVGRGGMADVYLAFDNKRQAPVAVKILREDLAEDPDFVRRFCREAEALAQLDHPNIVRFYAFEQDGPVAFIVMDYIEGTTLRRQLHDRRGPLEIKAVTAILRDLCGALHYAHLNGVVHRDLKPGNVMLMRDGKALLTDFGIARAGAAVTMTAPIMGTPPYMSPEQCEGAEPDARSDIYSLGVLLFEIATGRRPFTGDEPGLTETGTPARIQEAHLRLPPPEPRSLNPKLPAAASAIILRALAKRPADRWPDAVSLREAWEAALGVSAVLVAPTGAVARPTSQTVRRPFPRWAPVLVGVVLLAAIAAVAVASHGSREGWGEVQSTAPVMVQASATVVLTLPPSVPLPTARPIQGGGGVVQVGKSALEMGPRTPTLPLVPATDANTGTTEVTGAGTSTASLSTSGEPTLIPTFTLEPTREPATPTPRLVTPRPPATAQPSPSTSAGVTLLHPSDGEKVIGSAEFAWQDEPGFGLKAGEQYELIVWGEGEDPMKDGRSPVGASGQKRVQANLTGVEDVLRLSSGKAYYWGVRLLSANATPQRMLSGGRKFVYERAGGRGGQPAPGCSGPLC